MVSDDASGREDHGDVVRATEQLVRYARPLVLQR